MENHSTPRDAAAFVASLDLSADTAPGASYRTASSGNAAAWVCAGNVVAFLPGLTAQQRSDVLDSILIAALASDKMYNRKRQPVQWYASYTDILARIGWSGPPPRFEPFTPPGPTVQMDLQVLRTLGAIADGAELDAALEAVKALKGSSGSKAYVIWDTTTHDTSNGCFQVSSCSASGKDVRMAMAAAYFVTETAIIGDFLWMPFDVSRLQLSMAPASFTLDEKVYSTLRQQIAAKLGSRRDQYQAGIGG